MWINITGFPNWILPLIVLLQKTSFGFGREKKKKKKKKLLQRKPQLQSPGENSLGFAKENSLSTFAAETRSGWRGRGVGANLEVLSLILEMMRHNSCNIPIYSLTWGLNLLSSPPTCSLEWSLSLWPVPWPPIFLSCVQPGVITILWRGPRPPILPSYVEPGMIPILRWAVPPFVCALSLGFSYYSLAACQHFSSLAPFCSSQQQREKKKKRKKKKEKKKL